MSDIRTEIESCSLHCNRSSLSNLPLNCMGNDVMTFEVKHQQLLSQFSVILNFRIKLDKVSVTGHWKPAEGKAVEVPLSLRPCS